MCAAADYQTNHTHHEKNSLRGAVVNGRWWQWFDGAIRKIGDAPFVDDIFMHTCRRRLYDCDGIPHQYRASGGGRSRTGLTGTQVKLTRSLGHINRRHLHTVWVVQRDYLTISTAPLHGLTASLAVGNYFGGTVAFECPVGQ